MRDGAAFRLADFDPGDTSGLDIGKDDGKELLASGAKRLKDLQEKLHADGRYAILIIRQGMDAAGKDGVIEHVLSEVNPQGCEVHSFKAPSSAELAHDFLWRTTKVLPARGRIGVFNRSYYEEVLVVRVHPELLEPQKLPPDLVGKNIWTERDEDIRAFERHMVRSGTLVLKFFLNISKDEQRERFLARIDEPSKRWKFSMGDVDERGFWADYMAAYEAMIRATSVEDAPWHVIPADKKWFSRLVIAAAVVEALEKLDLQYPAMDEEALREMERARALLLEEARDSRRSSPS